MTGRGIGHVQVPNHPATAVKPRQDREGACPCRSVDTHWNSRTRARDIALFDPGDLWPGNPGTRLGVEARLLWGHHMRRGKAQGGELLHDLLRLWIKWHTVF